MQGARRAAAGHRYCDGYPTTASPANARPSPWPPTMGAAEPEAAPPRLTDVRGLLPAGALSWRVCWLQLLMRVRPRRACRPWTVAATGMPSFRRWLSRSTLLRTRRFAAFRFVARALLCVLCDHVFVDAMIEVTRESPVTSGSLIKIRRRICRVDTMCGSAEADAFSVTKSRR